MEKLKNKKLFLLDMDGTIYLDSDLFDGTLDFLAEVKNGGGKYLFLTNNSSKSAAAYVDKLGRIGIESCEEEFLTSTYATILYIKEKYQGRRFYSVGTGNGYSVLEMVCAFGEVWGSPVKYKIAPRRPGDIGECYADPTKAYNALGWRAERDLKKMCEDSARWQKMNPDGYPD